MNIFFSPPPPQTILRRAAPWLTALALLWQTTALAQHPDFPVLDTLPAPDTLPEYQLVALARRLADQTAQIHAVLYKKPNVRPWSGR
ncbi:MAG: hypothetical protein IPM98_00935 [Lewinellaceae bacterium]|nr:hypothetical protein [Lewinellaceae bacterium]